MMQKFLSYRGIYAPILTPYKENLEIDYDDLRRMVDFTIDCGCHGLVTTVNAAEFYTLTDEENHKTAEVVVRQTKGRIPVVVGIAGWSNKHSIYHAKFAEAIGADAVMSTAPVIKPTSWDEIRRYYHELDKAIHIPIIIQNAPPMGPEMTPGQIMQLCEECENIHFVKEETPFEVNYITAYIEGSKTMRPGSFGGVMSGNSGLTIIDAFLRGSCGCMPANHLGDVFVTIWELLEAGKIDEAYAIHEDIAPLLLYEGMYWMPNFYYIMFKRGIFKTDLYRTTAPGYTARHRVEVDHLLKAAEKYYRVK